MNLLKRSSYYLFVPALIGIGSFIHFFGVHRILGSGLPYDMPGGDLAQHIAGAYAYLDGKWSFPIFYTERLNSPEGLNIIYTDSAPFAGLIAKIINTLTGVRWNYLGTWFFALWVLQPMAAAYLARQLGVKGWAAPALIGVVALMFPPFLMRYGHLALSSHFLIIFALGLYAKDTKIENCSLSAILWSTLLVISAWTHAYIMAVCLTIFIACTLDILIKSPSKAFFRLSEATAIMTTVFLACFVGGYSLDNSGQSGYGVFSADVLSLFWPQNAGIWPAAAPFTNNVMSEGFNYVGAGGILAILSAGFFVRGAILKAIKNHPMLCLAMLACALFALGNTVYFAGKEIFSYPIPEHLPPYSVLRANGRMMWPVGYILVFASLFILASNISRKSRAAAISLLSFIAIVQTIDARNYVSAAKFGSQGEERSALLAAVRQAKEVVITPDIDCITNIQALDKATQVTEYAARYGTLSNTAHMARRTNALQCGFTGVSNDADVLTVIIPEVFQYENMPLGKCTSSDGLILCGEIIAENAFMPKMLQREKFSLAMPAGVLASHTQNGAFSNNALTSNGQGGFLFFGPYTTFPAGTYEMMLDADFPEPSKSIVDVQSDNKTVFATVTHQLSGRGPHIIRMDIPKISGEKGEVRLFVPGGEFVSVRGYSIKEIGPGAAN